MFWKAVHYQSQSAAYKHIIIITDEMQGSKETTVYFNPEDHNQHRHHKPSVFFRECSCDI
jgi:hypothetical protein